MIKTFPHGQSWISVTFPTVSRDNANGDWNSTVSIVTLADIWIRYFDKTVPSSGAWVAVQASSLTGATITHLTLGMWAFRFNKYDAAITSHANIDFQRPWGVSVIDSATKVFIDTGFEIYFNSDVQLNITFPEQLTKKVTGDYTIPIFVFPRDSENNIDYFIDSAEIAVKAEYATSGTDISNFYDDAAATTPATASTTFTGFKKLWNTPANGSPAIPAKTYFKILSSYVSDTITLNFRYKINGAIFYVTKMIFLSDGVYNNSEGQTIIDNVITNNTLVDNINTKVNSIDGDVTSIITDISNLENLSQADVDTAITNNTKIDNIDTNVTIIGTVVSNLNDLSTVDILAMMIDGTSFNDHLTNLQARTKGAWAKDPLDETRIVFKKKGGSSDAYAIKYNTSGRQEG